MRISPGCNAAGNPLISSRTKPRSAMSALDPTAEPVAGALARAVERARVRRDPIQPGIEMPPDRGLRHQRRVDRAEPRLPRGINPGDRGDCRTVHADADLEDGTAAAVAAPGAQHGN